MEILACLKYIHYVVQMKCKIQSDEANCKVTMYIFYSLTKTSAVGKCIT